MAVALEDFPSPPTTAGFHTGKHMASKGHSCPRCGTQVPGGGDVEEAQRKIRELQAQVEMLKDKATAAGT
jgi:tRNA(Ile2) C34 agmatinyltransferase TiaS